MLKLKKIAVTGYPASGKSTVCRFFQELGAYAVDSDAIVHQLLKTNSPLGKQIIDLLGADIMKKGQLNRKKIAEKVFSDPKKLQALEKQVHPYVLAEIKSQYEKVKDEKKHSLFIVEIPLLFEIGAESFFDFILTVKADEEKCKQRFGKNDYDKRVNRQYSTQKKEDKSDIVLYNNDTLKELKQKIKNLYDTFQ